MILIPGRAFFGRLEFDPPFQEALQEEIPK